MRETPAMTTTAGIRWEVQECGAIAIDEIVGMTRMGMVALCSKVSQKYLVYFKTMRLLQSVHCLYLFVGTSQHNFLSCNAQSKMNSYVVYFMNAIVSGTALA